MFGGFPFWSNGVLRKPLTQRLADEARGAQRRGMDKALLKSCLFLLTFSALASVGQSLPRETVALGDCPSGGPLCVAYKRETKPPNQLLGGETVIGFTRRSCGVGFSSSAFPSLPIHHFAARIANADPTTTPMVTRTHAERDRVALSHPREDER